MDEHVSNFHSCARISTSSKQNLKKLTGLESRALSTEQVHGNEVLPDRESVRRLQMDEHVIIISFFCSTI